MRGKILILFFCLIGFKTFATEQVPDILIIENDTFYLKTFPLNKLFLEKRFKTSPFKNNEWTTATYRGYIATWVIKNDSLFLKELKTTDETGETRPPKEFFSENNYDFIESEGLVFSDWYSDTLSKYEYYSYFFDSERFYLAGGLFRNTSCRNELIFNSGKLIENNIEAINSYQIGDILIREVSYYRHWLLKRGVVKVKAVVKENNGKKVRVEIENYGTTKKIALKEIRRLMGVREEDNYWVNPRYWNKNENNAP